MATSIKLKFGFILILSIAFVLCIFRDDNSLIPSKAVPEGESKQAVKYLANPELFEAKAIISKGKIDRKTILSFLEQGDEIISRAENSLWRTIRKKKEKHFEIELSSITVILMNVRHGFLQTSIFLEVSSEDDFMEVMENLKIIVDEIVIELQDLPAIEFKEKNWEQKWLRKSLYASTPIS